MAALLFSPSPAVSPSSSAAPPLRTRRGDSDNSFERSRQTRKVSIVFSCPSYLSSVPLSSFLSPSWWAVSPCCLRTVLDANSPQRRLGPLIVRCSTMTTRRQKVVWVWTESRQVMTAAVERGWDTFVFPANRTELANEWSSIALLHPLFVEGSYLFNGENKRVASFSEISSPHELEQLQPEEQQAENVVINLQEGWQVIPAENIVAAFQGRQKTVLAIATSSHEAQVFLEALEQGLGGVILKVDDVGHILKLKDYFDRIDEVTHSLSLTNVIVTRVQVVGMGDRVCVDLCSIMQPGEGLLVGSFARGLFLVHSECLESNYIASRPFRVNAGPVHAYVAVPGGKTCYLSELHAGKEVLVVNQKGHQRTAIVGRVKVESRPLILVEAKEDPNSDVSYSIFLQNAETVGLVCPHEGLSSLVFISSHNLVCSCTHHTVLSLAAEKHRTIIPLTCLKAGDKVLLRVQGGARHTGIEIQEFILEK